MTQYQSPYSLPNYYPAGYDPMSAYLGPARRAGVLMFVLGGLGMACGVCLGISALITPIESMISASGMNVPELPPGMSIGQLMRIAYVVMAVGLLIQSILMIVLGVFVRRGSVGAIITSLVICVLVTLFLLINFIGPLMQLGHAPGTAIMSLTMIAVPLCLYGLLIMWLLQAKRSADTVSAMRMQYQAQYWQYMQQQQMYQQGYGAAQQPLAPPLSPPSTQTSSDFNAPPPSPG